MTKQWYVFYTKSRQEKKVYDLLIKRNYDAFLPTQIVVRQWTDRRKKVEVPLFNSYIFVKDFEHKIPEILQTPGIAWNIRLNSKPAILQEDEVKVIKRFLTTGLTIEVDTLAQNSFNNGERAKIIDGPLKGQEGVILNQADAVYFNVALEGIDQLIRVQIPALLLQKL